MALNIGTILNCLMNELVEPTEHIPLSAAEELAKNNVKEILIGYMNGQIVEEVELVEAYEGK